MVLNIKNERAYKLAVDLARAKGVGVTEAVTDARSP
ncbi:MAG: type II toxin-antitoxin system VapB family antitoxin [Fimbriimonadaceae bacterium]|nr:type II toxin-antitoxin system VapB family antitoxin [Fimbriimonadaceae bacterium]